jgi:hypothetical protein
MSNVQESVDPKNESSNLPSSGEPKRKRGRPKGSKNKNLKPVEVDADRCEYCGVSDLETIRTDRFNRSGLWKGKPYNQQTVRRRKCRRCNRVQMRKSFDLV